MEVCDPLQGRRQGLADKNRGAHGPQHLHVTQRAVEIEDARPVFSSFCC